MQMCDRGVRYEKDFTPADTVHPEAPRTSRVGKYRGVSWTMPKLHVPLVRHLHARLKYRGVDDRGT